MKSAATQKALKAVPFQRALLSWYGTQGEKQRALPWRGTTDPYRIWLSEIMLQQTRVAAVLNYYSGFLRRFPTVQALAEAPEDQVLAAWSGLGYYRRARMLHLAARHLVEKHQGKIPTSYSELLQLPGIGKYTAAAIASIAFHEPLAVLDGNVERVLLRLTGAPEAAGSGNSAALLAQAQQLLDPKRPGDFNQAMMELGATVCLPQQPRCPECPVFAFCLTRGEHSTSARPQRQHGELHYALIRDPLRENGAIKLVQRNATDSLMPGMWELPRLDVTPRKKPLLRLRHSITVTDYEVWVHSATDPSTEASPNVPEAPQNAAGKWFSPEQAANLPLTGLTRKVLRGLGLVPHGRESAG